MKTLTEYNKSKTSATDYVDVFIVCGKEILCLRRANYLKFNRGKWCIPGGSIDKQESSSEAATREVKEETNISIYEPKFLFTHEYENGKMTSIFLSVLDEKPEVTISREHAQYKWLTFDQIEKIKEKFPPETFEILEKFSNIYM